MIWSLVVASIVFAGPSLPLSKGAFVGVFLLDGQDFQISLPAGERWVSSEQVQREVLFRGWKPPLRSEQMAELAKSLDANFAVDVLVTLWKTKGAKQRWKVLVVVRVVSASLGEIVHMKVNQASISSLGELPQVVGQICSASLSTLPTSIPCATVQLREGEKKLHLMAMDGNWGKGNQVLVFRESSAQITVLGRGRIVAADLPVGGNRWLLEVDLTKPYAPIRPGDKAVQIFTLPKPFSKWQ